MRKDPPTYVLDFVFHPEHDTDYVHFQDAGAHPFQPDPAGFPRVNAWWLADSALLTYWDPAKATTIFSRAGLTAEFIKVGSTDCYVASRHGLVIVAFRGTEPNEWQDILTDVKIQLVPWRAGKVHRGFKEALDAIWPALEPKLTALAPGRKVWFCGHSLGAALAVRAASARSGARAWATARSPRRSTHASREEPCAS
jgi:triacylglycerol lipase